MTTDPHEGRPIELVSDTFDDIDEMCATIETWDTEIIPLGGVGPGQHAGTIIQAGSLDCQYMYAALTPALSMRGDPPSGLMTFNVQERTRKHYWWRGKILEESMAWVFPFGGELRSVCAPGFRVHTLSVTEERVAKLAAQLAIELPPPSRRPESFRVPKPVLDRVRGGLKAMRDSSIPFPYHLVSDVLRSLLPHWLSAEVSRRASRPLARARDRALRISLELMDAHDLGTLTTDLMLDRCHVSERTLQYAFQERFGTSPAALIKSMRLARVRSALRSADPDEHKVGDIAAHLGFWHLGQFARDYRLRCGELPSATLARSV